MEDFGKKVRDHRLKLNLTQTGFGKRYGVSKSTVSIWEKGEVIPGKVLIDVLGWDEKDDR